MEHDELIKLIFKEYQMADKDKYTNLFLSSLSTHRLEWRSGLPVLAIMQSFPFHHFQSQSLPPNFKCLSEEDQHFVIKRMPCVICSNYKEAFADSNNQDSNNIGGLTDYTLDTFYQYLKSTNAMENVLPNEDDINIFLQMLRYIQEIDYNTTIKRGITSLISKIKEFETNLFELQLLLETLGYCSILETKEYKGLLHQYTNLSIAPKKRHNSDWHYPVDFWTGKDGINKKALDYWFGCYLSATE
ncbi:hypothetical protein [Prevotella pallens]|jgi:hypothetical protein